MKFCTLLGKMSRLAEQDSARNNVVIPWSIVHFIVVVVVLVGETTDSAVNFDPLMRVPLGIRSHWGSRTRTPVALQTFVRRCSRYTPIPRLLRPLKSHLSLPPLSLDFYLFTFFSLIFTVCLSLFSIPFLLVPNLSRVPKTFVLVINIFDLRAFVLGRDGNTERRRDGETEREREREGRGEKQRE